MSSALDVISAVLGSLKDVSLSFIEEANLIAVITGCMEDNDETVRQSAFGVLGDMAQYCFAAVKPHVNRFAVLCIKYVNIEWGCIAAIM